MDHFKLNGKKVAVLGMGIEGIALTRFLVESGSTVYALDQKSANEISHSLQAPEKEQFREIMADKSIIKILDGNYLDNLNQFDTVFRSPGISFLNEKIQKAKEKGVAVSSQIKLFFELCPCKIIGITGTKGKGTTSSLIHQIIENNFARIQSESKVYLAGNIGYPAISLLSKLKKNDIVVLELSSFQLMDMEKSPNIAVITNLTADHQNYHKSINEYHESKLNIIAHQSEDDFAVINKAVLTEFDLNNKIPSKTEFFSNIPQQGASAYIDKDNDGQSCVFLDYKKKKTLICKQNEINLLGLHNMENVAAASIVARILEVDIDILKNTIKDFKGLPHRLESIGSIDGVFYINDSFATNPEPTIAAIKAVPQEKIMILGGSSKGSDFLDLAKHINNSNVAAVVLIGDEAEKIKDSLENIGYKGKMVLGGKTMDMIVGRARELAKTGSVVLLSPACASFGLFKDYKDRGEQFKKVVLNLK